MIGYGYLQNPGDNPYLLYEAVTPLLSREECSIGVFYNQVNQRMLCAGYPSTGGIGFCHVSTIESVMKVNVNSGTGL